MSFGGRTLFEVHIIALSLKVNESHVSESRKDFKAKRADEKIKFISPIKQTVKVK